jgi:hypothetical protein
MSKLRSLRGARFQQDVARPPRYHARGWGERQAVVDHDLVVRTIPDEEPVLGVKVRER